MPAAKPKKPATESLVDAFGLLDEQLAALKKEHASARERLLAMVCDGELVVNLAGQVFNVEISAPAWEREIISISRVARKVGRVAFMNACTFPLAKLDALIPEAERGKFVTREQTGARKVTAARRFTA